MMGWLATVAACLLMALVLGQVFGRVPRWLTDRPRLYNVLFFGLLAVVIVGGRPPDDF